MRVRPVLGILGGMGPLATADFYRKVILATPAERDQDHIPVVMVADPTVPDRSAALLGHGDDPLPVLRRSIDGLSALGATFVAIPCNSVHAFLGALRSGSPIPILDMIDETARRVRGRDPNARTVGLLATAVTIQMGLYHEAMDRYGLRVLTPSKVDQERLVAPAIAAVKQGGIGLKTRQLLIEAAMLLRDRGTDVIVAGCTEIPIALSQTDVDMQLIDATQALAEAVVAHWAVRQDEEIAH
jgi:aspartate racemase